MFIKRISGTLLISFKGIVFYFDVILLQLSIFSWYYLGCATSCVTEHTCLVASLMDSVGAHYALSTT